MVQNIEVIAHKGCVEIRYNCKYAGGGLYVTTPKELVNAIEELCGKGSYCIYYDKQNPYPKAINHSEYILYPNAPRITYLQQAIKTEVIEYARDEAMKFFGDIPEMEIGWLENQCKTFVEDLK